VISRFTLGVKTFFEGIRILKDDKTLRALSLIPAIMSLTLYTAGLILGSFYIDNIMNWIIKSNMNDYNIFLKSLIYIFSLLLLGFILYFVTFFIVSILAIPVCSTLSQKILTRSGYSPKISKTLKDNIFTFASMVRVSLLKFVFMFIISGLLILASFVPIFAPIIMFLSLVILTFDCMDYAMELDELSLSQRFQFLFDHWIEFSGFSLCMALILAIPFIHFILLPSAVLGTSILYAKIQMSKKQGRI
jgi:uncharacterized protein involved in cysteine biosynthesis